MKKMSDGQKKGIRFQKCWDGAQAKSIYLIAQVRFIWQPKYVLDKCVEIMILES